MNPTTAKIFESYEVRKTKAQKQAFRDWVLPEIKDMDYPVRVEDGSFGSKNIVFGDPDTASVIFTAHYDTCVRLPFPNFIAPKSLSLCVLYQLLIVCGMLVTVFLCTAATYLILPILTGAGYLLSLVLILVLILAGPANRHTANDNTSGVTAILDLAREVPWKDRQKVAFILFDLEEAGMLGSKSYAKTHRAQMKHKLLVNLDCVSDGSDLFFAFRRKARKFRPVLEKSFVPDEQMQVVFSEKHHFYPSDQMRFPCGVGVAAMKRSGHGILYLNRIHTSRDVIYQEENIRFVVRGCLRLIQRI